MAWDYLFILFLPITVGSIATVIFASVGESIGLIDYPDQRKQHRQPTISSGGLSIFATILACGVLLLPKELNTWIYFFCGSLLMILGLIDDREDLPAIQRLFAQTIIALVMCINGELYIQQLGYLFGQQELMLSHWGYLLTVVAVIAAINAFNMIDGIDGLLGSTALIVFSALAILFSLSGDTDNLQFALLIALSLIPYLWANLQIRPVWIKKIFMGDTGSMLIGFTVVWLLIQGSQGELRSFSVMTALWLISFPLMDMARVMLIRKLNGQSMLEADRSHLHHLLEENLLGSPGTLFIINGFSLSAAGLGILLEVLSVPDLLSLMLFLAAFGLYVYTTQKVLLIQPLIVKG
ncbi:MAG: undecaprenyl-phosphate alpha-N-acetylglucosaminyl 1-phosphate transferase [Thiothrix nivea]|nr:MAG: undecaprenyl-phosphate alpha-N-acetylglucosaminyl 1-phosphate transferase [Thiothrix nivea]